MDADHCSRAILFLTWSGACQPCPGWGLRTSVAWRPRPVRATGDDVAHAQQVWYVEAYQSAAQTLRNWYAQCLAGAESIEAGRLDPDCARTGLILAGFVRPGNRLARGTGDTPDEYSPSPMRSRFKVSKAASAGSNSGPSAGRYAFALYTNCI